MDLFEYQAKQLFAEYGVPVPDAQVASRVATTSAEAEAVATGIGEAARVVVKAQVRAGGRGKAGGIKLADGPGEAARQASRILGMDIGGHTVRTVLIEPASEIAEEYYFSLLVDRASRSYLAIGSRYGGVDIEELAATDPGAVAAISLAPDTHVDHPAARELAAAANLPEPALDGAGELIERLWHVFTGADASLVEVNPMVRTSGDRVLALDAKATLDDNAGFRQDLARFAGGDEGEDADPLEGEARRRGINYVKLDGEVGVIGNGAGLVMSTLDVVAYAGADRGVRPSNFLDIGGGASAQVMADGLEIVLSDPSVRCVFINVFGGITACDQVAEGVLQALRLLDSRGEPVDRPLVVRLDGNNAGPARRILSEAAHPLIRQEDTMDGAARRAAELAGAPAEEA